MIQKKRVAAYIDLDAAAYNIQQIRRLTGKRIIGVVKANAYGHGALEIARVLAANGVDFFAVAAMEEAMELRRGGLAQPILILGYLPACDEEAAIAEDVRLAVWSYEKAEEISRAAVHMGKTAFLHIKVDTGMGRIGFTPEEAMRVVPVIAQLPGIQVEGLFTHFATADEEDKSFTREQIACFSQVMEAIEKQGLHIPITHCANSAAIMDIADLPFTAVRPGIILYGLYPSYEVKQERLSLRPVMRWVSSVSHVKTVEADTSIGYGRTWFSPGKRRIATIPVGYADGYARAMQQGGRVLIGGHAAPVVGRVCMDQFMVDVTDLPDNVQAGDEVVLMGTQGSESITAEEIAAVCGTISYEIICRIGARVPRVFTGE